MNIINVKKFGFATGFTAALLYVGCILVHRGSKWNSKIFE